MQTFFEDFTLDDGRKATVVWGWSGREECVLVESAWETESEQPIELSETENERFDRQVLALDPFPPHEVWED
ncbi:hypothetical protein [Azospirillum sp. Sh1]|uniref:hypothetical protein n=1 Tax=Azospirillum sp. Sh1 TaxID=2607285 RepID=UPI0011ED88CC|nr:hypothetical protein [Azospirillum sp. Sh1]KAA0571113.1 hypothetical protein FZ029_28070 [Azospirillum sp. Sh1]